MKSLPFILIALLLVGGVLAWVLLKNPKQRASVTAGEPTFGGGSSIDEDFVDSLPGPI